MSGWGAQSLANSGSSKLGIKDKHKCLIIRSRTPRGITWAPGSHCLPRPPLGSGVRAAHFSPQIMNSFWIAVRPECRSTQEVPAAAIPVFPFVLVAADLVLVASFVLLLTWTGRHFSGCHIVQWWSSAPVIPLPHHTVRPQCGVCFSVHGSETNCTFDVET